MLRRLWCLLHRKETVACVVPSVLSRRSLGCSVQDSGAVLARARRRCSSMSAVRFEPNFDKPLQIKPPPVPDSANDADLIANLSRETRELREQLRQLRREAPADDQPIVLRHISEIIAENREAEWLIEDVLEYKVLAVLAGARGTLKSFIALHWAMLIATGEEFYSCIMLSAEGAGLDRRCAAWMKRHREGGDPREVRMEAYELPLNLNSARELERLRVTCHKANPYLIVVDTMSKYSAGLEENSNGEMALFLAGLGSVRDEFDCTVLLVAHSGHGDAKRPRGAYALMGNPDAEYIVERIGMTVTVTRERFKDTASLPPLAYEAKVIDLGRDDRRGRPVTSLALVRTEAPDTSAPAKGNGGNQKKLVVALKEWIRANPESTHVSTIDMRALCKAQGVSRQRQAEVVSSFVANRILTPSVGGWALHGENL